jgi:hypothetical protein
MTRLALIDADIVAYQAASKYQNTFDFGDGDPVVDLDMEGAQQFFSETVDYYINQSFADDYLLCFSDDFQNWRKSVLPTYKSNRTGERPELLYPIKSWAFDQFKSVRKPTLEADDVMGILSTDPSETRETVIISLDKDMKTIPGLFLRPRGDFIIEDISEEQADRWHLMQTLAGDVTDGYQGCHGIGMGKAAYYLEGRLRPVAYYKEITRGPRKGEQDLKWRDEPATDPWDTVVRLYEKHGFTEKDALIQARVARILRFDEYVNGRPKLWNPKVYT